MAFLMKAAWPPDAVIQRPCKGFVLGRYPGAGRRVSHESGPHGMVNVLPPKSSPRELLLLTGEHGARILEIEGQSLAVLYLTEQNLARVLELLAERGRRKEGLRSRRPSFSSELMSLKQVKKACLVCLAFCGACASPSREISACASPP